MKTFKEYIEEMAMLNKNIPHDMDWNVSKKDEAWNLEHKQIGETDTHTIHRGEHISGQVVYYAKNKKTKKNDLSIWGEEKKNNFSIDAMSKHQKADGSMKMHHLIHHLLHHHGLDGIGSDEYSEGGHKVMKNLEDMPDVKLTYHKARKQVSKPENELGDPAVSGKHKNKAHWNNTYIVARRNDI